MSNFTLKILELLFQYEKYRQPHQLEEMVKLIDNEMEVLDDEISQIISNAIKDLNDSTNR